MRERTDWLTKGVRGIGAASFLSDLGHEVPTALLPRLLTQSFGASAAALGIIEGLADGLAGFFRFFSGALADDPDRRRDVAVGGYTATALLTAGIGAATTVWQVGLLRAGGWAARGLRVPARNALLADAVPADAYGRAYGFERMMDNLGAVAGPLLALALVAAFDVRTAILISVVPGLVAALAIIYAIRHLRSLTRREREPLRFHVRAVLHGRLARLMAGVSLFEFGNVAVTFLILRATDLLTPDRGLESATFVAFLLYLAYNVAATLTPGRVLAALCVGLLLALLALQGRWVVDGDMLRGPKRARLALAQATDASVSRDEDGNAFLRIEGPVDKVRIPVA